MHDQLRELANNERKNATENSGLKGGTKNVVCSSERYAKFLGLSQPFAFPTHPWAKSGHFASYLLGEVCKEERDIMLFRSSWWS